MQKNIFIEGYKHYTENNLKHWQKEKKTVEYITPTMDHYPRNG